MSVIRLKEIEEREAIPGFHGRFLHSEQATLVFWQAQAGAVLPEHHHPHEQIATILQGRFTLVIDGVRHELSTGEVAVIPPNAMHSGQALTACEILDVFTPVRDDYKL